MTLWGRTAEISGEYLNMGRPVYIEGRLQMDSWDDKNTGQKRTKLKVVGESLQFLGSRDGGGSSSCSQQSSASNFSGSNNQTSAPNNDGAQFDAEDDDIPF